MSVETILRIADKSQGYLEGYDDGINDVLKWLRAADADLADMLVVDIEISNRSKSRPIVVRK